MPSSSSKWPSRIKKSGQKTSFPHSTKGYYQNRAFELDWLCSHISYWYDNVPLQLIHWVLVVWMVGSVLGMQHTTHHKEVGHLFSSLESFLTLCEWLIQRCIEFSSLDCNLEVTLLSQSHHTKSESCHQEDVSLPLALLLNFPSAGVRITCFSYFPDCHIQPCSVFMVTSTTIYTSYKAQTMCKKRFCSQGVILDGF